MGHSFGPSKTTIVCHNFGPSKITIEGCNFGLFKLMLVSRNFGWSKVTIARGNFGRSKIINVGRNYGLPNIMIEVMQFKPKGLYDLNNQRLHLRVARYNPTTQNKTPLVYPTPRSPSSLAWDRIRDHSGRCCAPPSIRQESGSTKVNRGFGSARYFSIVNPPISLDGRALYKQLQGLPYYHSILHHGHHPPRLEMSSGTTLMGATHPPLFNRKAALPWLTGPSALQCI